MTKAKSAPVRAPRTKPTASDAVKASAEVRASADTHAVPPGATTGLLDVATVGTSLIALFAAVDAMGAAVAANDETAANDAGAKLLAAATAVKGASSDIDRVIEQLVADRLKAADEEADRQLAEKRDRLAADLQALNSTDAISSDVRAPQGVGGDQPTVPATGARVRVVGPKKGRWRIGRHFTPEGHEVNATAAELEQLRADPQLTVQVLPAE